MAASCTEMYHGMSSGFQRQEKAKVAGMSSVIQVTSVNYPESDGQPMGETDEHRDEMVREIELLRRFFEDQDVYVSGTC